jgi:hypothetical protein
MATTMHLFFLVDTAEAAATTTTTTTKKKKTFLALENASSHGAAEMVWSGRDLPTTYLPTYPYLSLPTYLPTATLPGHSMFFSLAIISEFLLRSI